MSKRAVPFGKYLLLQRIDVGGMAEVYKGRLADEGKDGRLFAIKRILPAVAADQDFIDMFIDEAKISVELEHPNIATTYEMGRTNELYYMALEYISGRDLRSLFERRRKQGNALPPALVAYVMTRVAEGLDYAHRKRAKADGTPMEIIHRDISPQNILVSYDGEVKIIDFGIAKAANKVLKTQAGVLKGKFGYMSPEQVRGLPIDRRSDIFSAGIILHELLTGERLFVGSSDYAVLEKVRSAAVLPARASRPAVPTELDDIALKALSADRDQRYQHSGELAAHLQFFLDEQEEPFTREALASFMRETFPAEFEQEKRDNAESYVASDDPGGPVSNPQISMPEIRPALLKGPSASGARPRLEGGIARPSADVRAPTATEENASLRTPMSAGATSIRHDTPLPEPPSTVDVSALTGLTGGIEDQPTRARALAPPPDPKPRRSALKEEPPRAKPPPVAEFKNERTAIHQEGVPRAARPDAREATPKIAPAGMSSTGRSVMAVAGVVALGLVAIGTIGFSMLRTHGSAADDDDGNGKIHFDFAPLSPPGRATIRVTTDPNDAMVFIDGKLVKSGGTAPYVNDHIEARTEHEVIARKAGFHEERLTVALSKGETHEFQLKLRSGQQQLIINTIPPGAHIFIDGNEAGRSGGAVSALEPGPHSVRAEMDCYEPATQDFSVAAGEDTSLNLALKPMPGACINNAVAPTDPGFLELVAHPSGHVFVDGTDINRMTPLLDYPLPPGHHTVRVAIDDDARVIEVEVKPGKILSQTIDFH